MLSVGYNLLKQLSKLFVLSYMIASSPVNTVLLTNVKQAAIKVSPSVES